MDLLSEMQAKLNLRNRQIMGDNSGQGQGDSDSSGSTAAPDVRRGGKAPASTPGNGAGPRPGQANGSESPKPFRRRNPSLTGSDAVSAPSNNSSSSSGGANASDMEALKQEILTEMRREMTKMKTDIIEAIRQEMNRR